MAKTILGLDLGTSSVGWALLQMDSQGKPCGIEASGVRIFPQGVDGNIQKGQEESHNVQRRNARQARRQTWRRKRRILKTQRILQGADLLPKGGEEGEQARHDMIILLDAQLRHSLYPALDRREAHLMPYLLRRDALDRELPRHALGRAILHLSMRRGFLSNRKAPLKDAEETGIVKSSIDGLAQEIEGTGCRTLGEYFATRDPEQRRIRQQYLGREQIHKELELIWKSQEVYHSDLDEDLKARIFRSVLDQRPLRSQKNLVGFCELEEDQRKIVKAHRLFQRFRILQSVNNIKIIELATGIEQGLTEGQRSDLLEQLSNGSLTWPRAKKVLGYKSKEVLINLENTGDKKLMGDTSAERIISVLGERWHGMSSDDKDALIEDLLSFEKALPLAKRGRNHWKLSAEESKEFADLVLEDGYGSLSRRAIEKLLPLMEEGVPFATARMKIYPSIAGGAPTEILPPYEEALGNLRNPAVERTLSELRKVVNSIIRKHGKPEKIHIELARDLKKPRSVRQKIQKNQREREKERATAKEKLLATHLVPQPTRRDVEKYLLADECHWQCPYTGERFNFSDLFGDHPAIDIEHIIPFSRSQDNSFRNKTLCLRRENARKGNKTPYETYQGDRYDEVLARVDRFKGDLQRSKSRLFRMESIPEDFHARDLNDTAYASRAAQDYLGLLYGGVIDASNKRRIQPSGGQTTARLRRNWGLEGLLGGVGKNRDDHRHHAIDATVVALVNSNWIEQISRAAESAQESALPRLITQIPDPWPNFVADVRQQTEEMVISRRVSRKVRGPLHQETIYSHEKALPGGGDPTSRIRKPLESLSPPAVDKIIDPTVREAVQKALAKSGESDPKKAFKDGQNLPRLPRRGGPDTIIRRVRIADAGKTIAIGRGDRRRLVKAGNNQHAEIVAVLHPDTGETLRWESHIVTLLEAHHRKQEGLSVVQRDHGPHRKFLFSLCTGDHIEEDTEDGSGRRLTRIIGISANAIERVSTFDSRSNSVRNKLKSGRILKTLYKMHAKKVEVLPLGEVRDCHD